MKKNITLKSPVTSSKAVSPVAGFTDGRKVVHQSTKAGGQLSDKEPSPDLVASVYSSPIAASAYEAVSDLAALGLVDKTTMAEFDASCLTPVAQLAAPDIKALREREKVSQGVFAKYLGVAVNTLGQWERGLRRPDGPALKLLALVDRHGLDHIR